MTFEYIFIILLLVLYYFWSRRDLYVAAAKIPGYNTVILLGTIKRILCSRDTTVIFDILNEALDKYGSPTKMWFANILSVYIDKPEHLQVILNSSKCLQKSFFYKFLGVDYGLIASDGELYFLFFLFTFCCVMVHLSIIYTTCHFEVCFESCENYLTKSDLDCE